MWIDDELLERCAERLVVSTWVPESPLVVLGSSNVAEAEVEVERCAKDGIPVLKRYGGGGTVLLHSGCVVASVGAWVRQPFQNKFYFERLNQALIDALADSWPACSGLGQRGLSDIVHGDRKIAGTSLFRSRNYLLYQVSLLVEADVAAIGLYLKHPTKEPDYRKGRSHASFLAGLSDVVPGLDAETCRMRLESAFSDCLERQLEGELIAPETAQFPALTARAERGRQSDEPAEG